jgi:hypothetical protein
MLMLASVILACGAIEDEPPPRNPLAETAGAAAPTFAAATPSAPVSTPPLGDVTPPPAALAEPATARAIELLAEWIGVPQTELTPVSTEAVVWPDQCLGVARPVICAQVVTPGFRVRLEDAFGTSHTMHVDAAGTGARWAGEATAFGVVIAEDFPGRRITVRVDGAPLELRIAPGTSWAQDDTPASFVGRSVTFAYDATPAAAGPPLLAWVVLDPP